MKRLLCSVAFGIVVEAVLVWLFLRTFSFHDAKQPSILILNIHGPAMRLFSLIVTPENALSWSFLAMAFVWSAGFYIIIALLERVRSHEAPSA
jgi:hypothetical protein